MFEQAEREGLWFYSPYQQLWFSPRQLRAHHEAGKFRWGAVNWKLRDPRERIADLRDEAAKLTQQADAMEAELA